MASDEKWYFTNEQLANTPSRKQGYDADKELSCRQQAANYIQDMGIRLQVTQLCINTAIVYMHRFYMFHSFTRFHRTSIAAAALFLAAKVEEQPRKLEHVIKIAQVCLHRDVQPFDVGSEAYMEHAQELVMNENILLQTLGFDVAIDHPHTHVVRCCHLVKASKDLAQTSYFMASNSLHLTTMCLQYKPTVVACFCIHLACKWSNWEITPSTEGKPWFWYVDRTVTQELLQQLTEEFLIIFEKCPSRLKKKISAISTVRNQDEKKEVRRSKADPDQLPPSAPTGIHPGRMSSVPSTSNSISSNSAITSNSEYMKKKTEMSQRPPPDYKKPHSSHHPRMDNHSGAVVGPSNMSKSVYNPMQRAHHSSSSSSGSSSSGGHTSRPPPGVAGGPPPPHRSRPRPDQPPPMPAPPAAAPPLPRNGTHHDPGVYHNKPLRPSVDKVQCQSAPTTSTSPLTQFFPPQPVNSSADHPLPVLPAPPPKLLTPIDPPTPPLPPVSKAPPPAPPAPPKPTPPPPPPVAPVMKVERSIFSPEKTTPPPAEPLTSPPAVNPPPTPGKSSRIRNSSSSSETEALLTPLTIKTQKIEMVSGFEALGMGSTTIKLPHVQELIQPIKDPGDEPAPVKEDKPPDLVPPPQDTETSHSKEHKKKKKKHKEGKSHKHKDKDREKEKHKHKHKNREPEPIVITIPKEKITYHPPQPEAGLKIKIAKDKISPPPPSSLKIKIPKDKIKESKKRDRSEDRGLPSAKHHRPNGTTLQISLE